MALVVLDERRIQANRRDICFWIVVPQEETAEGSTPRDGDIGQESVTIEKELGFQNSVQPFSETELGTGRRESDPPEQVKEPEVVGNLDTTSLSKDESDSDDIMKNMDQNPIAPPSGIGRGDAEVPESLNEEKQGNYQLADRLMLWYSRKLIPQRWFQIVVCVVFLGYFSLCCYSTTLLKQEFRTQDFVVRHCTPRLSFISLDFILATIF